MRRYLIAFLALLGLFASTPTLAASGANCGPGTCIKPELPANTLPSTTPVTNNLNQVLLNGNFNGLATDPSFGDDSFVYHIKLVSLTTWKEYKALAQQTNESCTDCLPTTIGFKATNGWTDTAGFTLNLGYSAGGATLGATLQQQTALQASREVSFSTTFQLACCSANVIFEEDAYYKYTFDIAWQQDILGGWTDMGHQLYTATGLLSGFKVVSNLGSCVPEPEDYLMALSGGIVLLGVRRRKLFFQRRLTPVKPVDGSLSLLLQCAGTGPTNVTHQCSSPSRHSSR